MKNKNTWPKLSRFSNVVSLIAGIVFLAQFLWVMVSGLRKGIPLWLFLTSSICCLICGYYFACWLKNRTSSRPSGRKLSKLGQIRFDYLPSLPTENGWDLRFDTRSEDFKNHPVFSAVVDAPMAGSLNIQDRGRYYMDYAVEQVQSLANIVEYNVKPTRNGSFYLRINVSSRDGSPRNPVWLRHVVGSAPPRRMSPSEWSFSLQGQLLEDGWTLLKVSIEEEAEKTFGKEGLVYQSIRSVRIRGSLSLSPITFYRIE